MTEETKDIALAREEIDKLLKEFLEAPPSSGELSDLMHRRSDMFIAEFIRVLDEPEKTEFLEKISALFTDLRDRRMDLLTAELLKLLNKPEKMAFLRQLATWKSECRKAN